MVSERGMCFHFMVSNMKKKMEDAEQCFGPVDCCPVVNSPSTEVRARRLETNAS